MQNARVERSSHYLTWHHPIWIGSIIHGREKSVNMPGIAYQRQTILPLIGMPTQWHNTFFINKNATNLVTEDYNSWTIYVNKNMQHTHGFKHCACPQCLVTINIP
jgi:hypothetical protein